MGPKLAAPMTRLVDSHQAMTAAALVPAEVCDGGNAPGDFKPATPGQTRSHSKSKQILHLFSGPSGRRDGLLCYAKAAGADGEDWDIENGREYDLLDDIIYNTLLDRIKAGELDAGMLGPPCGTFSNARREDDFGPRPLRLPGPQGIYGRNDLTVDESKSVRRARFWHCALPRCLRPSGSWADP